MPKQTEVEKLVEEMADAITMYGTRGALRVVLKAVEDGKVVDIGCVIDKNGWAQSCITFRSEFKEFLEAK